MKELLHIPTGSIITFYLMSGPCNLGTLFQTSMKPIEVSWVIARIADGSWRDDFYRLNNIPKITSPAEFEVIDV